MVAFDFVVRELIAYLYKLFVQTFTKQLFEATPHYMYHEYSEIGRMSKNALPKNI